MSLVHSTCTAHEPSKRQYGALFRLQKICNSDTVAFSFVFDKFYLIMD
jgi:hypothetical protein